MPTADGRTAAQMSMNGCPTTSTSGERTLDAILVSLEPATRWSTSTPRRRSRRGGEVPDDGGQVVRCLPGTPPPRRWSRRVVAPDLLHQFRGGRACPRRRSGWPGLSWPGPFPPRARPPEPEAGASVCFLEGAARGGRDERDRLSGSSRNAGRGQREDPGRLPCRSSSVHGALLVGRPRPPQRSGPREVFDHQAAFGRHRRHLAPARDLRTRRRPVPPASTSAPYWPAPHGYLLRSYPSSRVGGCGRTWRGKRSRGGTGRGPPPAQACLGKGRGFRGGGGPGCLRNGRGVRGGGAPGLFSGMGGGSRGRGPACLRNGRGFAGGRGPACLRNGRGFRGGGPRVSPEWAGVRGGGGPPRVSGMGRGVRGGGAPRRVGLPSFCGPYPERHYREPWCGGWPLVPVRLAVTRPGTC